MEKFTIYQLTKYYVDRYHLPTDNRAGTPAHEDDGMGAYYTQIVRILKNCTVGEWSLYEAMKPKDEKSTTRVITLEDFERHCLEAFADYILKKYPKEHDDALLLADMERWKIDYDSRYWQEKAEEAIQAQNAALEQGLFIPGEEVTYEDDAAEARTEKQKTFEEKVEAKASMLMLEGLFNKFYGEFLWDKLREDMMNEEPLSGSSYNAEITAETMRASARLKSFQNYIGKKTE